MRNLALSSLLIATTLACGPSTSNANDVSDAAVQTAGDSAAPPSPSPDGGPADAGGDAMAEAGADASSSAATGTVGGHAFAFAYGIATPKVAGGAPGYQVLLSDKPIDCAGATIESSTSVDIIFAGQPPATQTYTVIDAMKGDQGPGEASSDFNVLDATCGTVLSNTSLSGTATLTKFDATSVEGSLDITFQSKTGTSNGSVAGVFHAVVCTAFPPLTCTPH